MNRRDALKAVSLIMGGAVIGGQAFLSGCQSATEERGTERFTAEDQALLDEIGETIIPTTETPGAKAVGIGAFMIMMVQDVYDKKHQETFAEGLEKVRGGFEDAYGHSFMKGSAEERHQFLNKLNADLEPYEYQKKDGDPEHYFRLMKELTLLGYFSSEIGSTQALRYIETPGRYEACIPYEKGDRAWAI